jgi:hypothetical protein
MKKITPFLFFVLLTAALAACRSTTQPTHTTVPLADTPSSPTPEPPTATAEITSTETQTPPETAVLTLPASCLVEGALTYVNRGGGYCFAYPPEFNFSEDAGVSISSEPLDSSPEPLIVSASIMVLTAGGQTLDAAVQAFLQEYVGANPPWEIRSADITVGTDTGRFLEPVPGRLSSRAVVALHNQLVYRFIFYPTPVNPDGSLNVQPGVPVYDKFQTLYAAVMGSFNYLDNLTSKIDVPLSCLEPDRPFTFDPAKGECSILPTPQPTSTPTAQPTSASTPEPTVEATPDPNEGLGGQLFDDPFDGSSGWLWGFTEAGVVSFSIDNGSVLAHLEAANKGWRISMGPDSFHAGDQQASLTGRIVACGDKDEVGLFFRGALTSSDKFNGYVFKLNCSGMVSLDRLASNQSTPLLGWTPVTNVIAGSGTQYTLMVWARQGELRLYLNGMYVATVRDDTYTSGEYGLYVNGRTLKNAEFRFSDLRVFEVVP